MAKENAGEQDIREKIRRLESMIKELTPDAAHDASLLAEINRQRQEIQNLKYELKSRGIRY